MSAEHRRTPDRRLERLFTPWRIAITLAVLLLIAVLREPASSPDSAWRLTSYAADPNGARGLYEVAETLGWKTSRRLTGFGVPLDSSSLYLVLDPAVELTAGEVGRLLDAVRKGAGLVVVPNRGSRIADSLPVWTAAGGMFSPVYQVTDSSYATPRDQIVSQAQMWPRATLRAREPVHSDKIVFLAAKRFHGKSAGEGAPAGESIDPVVLGIPFGAGRIVAIADPTFLRNDVLRHGRTVMLAIRALEWALPDSASPVVFDEYHQGFGRHASIFGAIGSFLGTTPSGLALLQLCIAGLLLIAALGPRPLVPIRREQIERRSALEHVDALAAAYEGARAARTTARRLVRGLRRRHPIGSSATLPEADYLALLRARRPLLAADAQLLAEACESGIVHTRLGELLAASDRIDQMLHRR